MKVNTIRVVVQTGEPVIIVVRNNPPVNVVATEINVMRYESSVVIYRKVKVSIIIMQLTIMTRFNGNPSFSSCRALI